jgi:hypothetical protein
MIFNLQYLVIALAFVESTTVSAPEDKTVGKDCTCQGKKLYGKIKFVENFPDLKIKFVENFPDLKVKLVQNFPDECGKWQIVENFPDLKVQVVENFPDIKIKLVDNFPGLP